jgi:hypothetical protein
MTAFGRKEECFPTVCHTSIVGWRKTGTPCYQLMETDSPQLFDEWIEQWKDIVSFKVIELEEK